MFTNKGNDIFMGASNNICDVTLVSHSFGVIVMLLIISQYILGYRHAAPYWAFVQQTMAQPKCPVSGYTGFNTSVQLLQVVIICDYCSCIFLETPTKVTLV